MQSFIKALDLANLLSRLEQPLPMGVLRAVEWPPFEAQTKQQLEDAKGKLGEGDLAKLLASGETWTVK